MKHRFLIIEIACILLLAMIAYTAYARTRPLAINTPSGTICDVGSVPYPTVVKHTFKIENPNTYSVALSIPTIGCACTKAYPSSNTIPSHGVADVDVTVTPDEPGQISAGVCAQVEYNGKKVQTWLFVTGTAVKSPSKTHGELKSRGGNQK
jgi:hypothetical protein